MFMNKQKIYALWGIIVGLLVIITVQAFGTHGFVMMDRGSSVKNEGVGKSKEIKTETKSGMDKEENLSGKTIRICIQGAVKKPGTVVLPEKSRLEDAVRETGGFTESAATRYLNLAGFLEDGAFIYIQTKAEEKKNGESPTSYESKSGAAETGKININTASAKELDSLPGVGAATAEKIIAYRKSKGAFKKIEDLKNVSGIGDGKFNKLKELIRV